MILKSIFHKRYPASLIHFVTYRCNACCSHCFIDFDNSATSRNELNLEEIKKIARGIKGIVYNVNLTGGEPFLREDLQKIVDAYYSIADVKSIYISTNGSYARHAIKLAEHVKAYHPKKDLTISISIDHLPAIHDKNRGLSGLCRKALNLYSQIEALKSDKIKGVVNITIALFNMGDVKEIYKYLKKNGVKAITVGAIRKKRITLRESSGILRAYMEIDLLLRAEKKSGNLGRNTFGNLIYSKNAVMREEIIKTIMENRYISPCYAGKLTGVIYPDGTVYPCEMLESCMGSLREYGHDLKRVWDSKDAREIRKKIMESKCFCTYECAWTGNILFNRKYHPRLLIECFKSVLKWK
jgi:radical SAM protein with 4Fe4S-binding SPASM domain